MAAPLPYAAPTDPEGPASGGSPTALPLLDGPALDGPALDGPADDELPFDDSALDGLPFDVRPFDGTALGGTPLEGTPADGMARSGGVPLPDAASSTQMLAWWATGLLNAVVAADASEDGEPVLAAAGHAATAALLLLQHRAAGDGDRARLREAYGVSVDQVAIVRELLQERAAAPSASRASRQAATPAGGCPEANRPRQRRRRLRLIRGDR